MHFQEGSRYNQTLSSCLIKVGPGISLVVQWLRLHAPDAGNLGLIPGQGTRSHMLQLKDPVCHNEDERSHVPQ